MSTDVKPPRAYRSEHRRRQAQGTRSLIVKAAARSFAARGWGKTTIAGIARDASVSPETIYTVFGNKRAILRALFTEAVRGAQPDVPLLEQGGPRAVFAETDQVRQIELFARDISRILARVAPLMAVVRTAAETDPGMAELYAELHQARRKNLCALADALAARGPLRGGIGVEEACRVLWRMASPELFLLITRVEKQPLDAYASWLGRSLAALLLGTKEAADS